MNYGLDEDDDLNRWVTQQATEASLQGLLEPDAGYGPPATFQPPAHAEMAPLNIDTGPDWSDALGAGTIGLAALADLGLNHGRGTGQILASGANFGAARAQQRLQQTQDALSYEEKRAQLEKSNRYNDYLYASMAQRGQNQGLSAALRAESNQTAAQNAATKAHGESRQTTNDDPTPFIAWAKEKGYDLEGLQSMSAARAALGPLMKEWDLAHADDRARATAEGRIGAELDNADALGDAAATKAAKVEQATEPGAIRKIEAGAIAKARADRSAAGEKSYANVDVVDPNVVSSLNTKQVNDMNDLSQTKVQFEKAMNDMAEIQSRNGMQVMPSGDKAAYDTAQAAAIGSLTKLFATGVLAEPEYKRMKERIPSSGISAGGVMGTVGDQISSTRDELSGVFDAALSQFGVRGKKQGQEQPPRLGGGVSQANGARPMSGGGPTGDMVKVTSPSGNSNYVTAEQAEKLKIIPGWKVP